MIAGIDQLLLSIRTAHATDPRHFDIDTWIAGARVAGGASAIAIVDRHGMLQPNAHPPLARRSTSPIARHFLYQQYSSADNLFISEPLLLRTTGRWSVPIQPQRSPRPTAASTASSCCRWIRPG